MSGDNTLDVRTRVSEREHKVLTAVSQATGRDIADIVRTLIVDWSEREIHRAAKVSAVLRDDKGRAGEGQGRLDP